MAIQNYDMALIVITKGRITVRAMAINGDGSSVSEEYGRGPAGEEVHFSGNFDDEPDLSDGLREALCCLQGPALAVMEELIAT